MAGAETLQPAPGLFAEPADWEDELFAELGVTHPTAADRAFFAKWFAEEHGAGLETGAKATGYAFDAVAGTLTPTGLEQHGGEFNPFDTTLPEAGASELNTVGVQNYPTAEEGFRATVDTLEDSPASYGYGPILEGMRGGASLTQLEKLEAESSWGNAFPAEGPVSSPVTTPGTASSVGGAVGGVAEDIAGGIISSLRDLLEMAAGVALCYLGAVMIVRDLQGAGVPLAGAVRPIARAVSPSRRRARTATRAGTVARTETARTRAAAAVAERPHVERRAEAATKAAEHRTARERAIVRQEQARARQEEGAATILRRSGSTAGGTTKPARAMTRAREAAQRRAYERATVHESGMRPGSGVRHRPEADRYADEPAF